MAPQWRGSPGALGRGGMQRGSGAERGWKSEAISVTSHSQGGVSQGCSPCARGRACRSCRCRGAGGAGARQEQGHNAGGAAAGARGLGEGSTAGLAAAVPCAKR